MMDLLTYLNDRLKQQEHRKMMIPRYLLKPLAFLGKRDFSLNDLPAIDKDIEEIKAAIVAVESLRKGMKITFRSKDQVEFKKEAL